MGNLIHSGLTLLFVTILFHHFMTKGQIMLDVQMLIVS